MKYFGSHGAVVPLFRKVSPLFPMPGSKVLGLQLSQGLHHPRDEVCVLALFHSVNLNMQSILNSERHQSRDGLW